MGYFDDVDNLAVTDFWPDGKVLEEFYLDPKKYVIIRGPYGSAKTKTAAAKLQDSICDMPPDIFGVRRSKALVFRNYENDLKTTAIPDWLSLWPEDGAGVGVMMGSSPLIHYLDFIGGDGIPVKAEVHFMPLSNVEEARKKLKGQEYTFVWGNEASEQEWLVVQTALGRMGGRYPPKGEMPDIDFDGRGNRYPSQAIFDSNSCDDEHWMYQLMEHPTPEQEALWGLHNQPGGVMKAPDGVGWVPNPNAENINNLGATYYSDQLALAAVNGESESFVRINLANMYGRIMSGKPCWHNYNPDLHDTSEMDYVPGQAVYMGMDFGRTPAIVLGQRLNGGTLIFDEYTSDDMSAEIFAPNARRWLMEKYGLEAKDIKGWCDPSGEQKGQATENQALLEMQAQGFKKLMSSPVTDNNTISRRKAMVEPFARLLVTGRPALMIHTRCKTVRAAASGKFYYKKVANSSGMDERYALEPMKNFYSHVAEAAEYLQTGFGEGQAYDDGNKKPQNRKSGMPNRRHH